MDVKEEIVGTPGIRSKHHLCLDPLLDVKADWAPAQRGALSHLHLVPLITRHDWLVCFCST